MEHKNQQQTQTLGQIVREIVILLFVVFTVRTFFFGLYQVPTGSMEVTMLVGERFFGDKLSMWMRDPKRGEIIAFNDVQFAYSNNPIMRMIQQYVWGPLNLTKRVIGVPGDRIRGVIEDGKPVIFINNERLYEPYLNPYPLLAVRKPTKRTLDFKVVTYDPNLAYDKQPFYRIDPTMVVRVRPGMLDASYTITEDGRLLELPGMPIAASRSRGIHQGKNYWSESDEFYIELGPNQFWVMGDNRRGSKDSRFFGPIDRHLIHARIPLRLWSIDSDESWWIWDLVKHPIDFWSRMRWSRFFQWV